MSIALDGARVTELVQRLGGAQALQEAWQSFDPNGHDTIDRATISRWENGQLPRNADRLLKLAACLDVDPLAILDLPTGDISHVAERMINMVQKVVGSPASLQFTRDFFGRLRQWPPQELARRYYGRNWYTREFRHDATVRQNYYETVELMCDAEREVWRPQVFHFAFRHCERWAGRWLQYGFVLVSSERVALWHIDGSNEGYSPGAPNEPARVRTHFGPGSVTFRVASLHDFQLATLGGRDAGAPTVTFRA